MKIEVKQEHYYTAPEGMAVYAQNPSYVDSEGSELLEALKHEAMRVDADTGKTYYHALIVRRRSTDNGQTWQDDLVISQEDGEMLAGEQRNVPMHVLDPTRNILISFYSTYEVDPDEPMFQGGNLRQRSYLMHYRVSRDQGHSWSDAKQVIDSSGGYNKSNWGPGLEFGKNGAMADMLAYTWLDDGSLVFGLTASNVLDPSAEGEYAGEGQWGTMYIRARWNEDGSDLLFQCGDIVSLAADKASGGCCEPAVACLGGERLFNVMRCQGDEELGIYSSRYSTVSEDGGMTWSQPEQLKYDDGSTVWTPASFSQFVTLSKTNKTYWMANILPGPVYGQMPRYPLTIAEFDKERCCILKDTVRVIKDLPEGAPEQRRYTNWGSYEDRETGELVITMPEQPMHMDYTAMTKPEEFTADCIRFRVEIG